MPSDDRLYPQIDFAGEPEAATFNGHDLLTEFASEGTPQRSTPPPPTIPARLTRTGFIAADGPAPMLPVWQETVARLPRRPHTSRRRPRKWFSSLAAHARQRMARSIETIQGLTLASFAIGSAAGILVMWIAGMQPATAGQPTTADPRSTAQTSTPEPAPPQQDASPSQPDAARATDAIKASPAPAASSTRRDTTREIGTSGRSAGRVRSKTAARSRVTPTAPAKPEQAAGARRSSYRGSLTFRSAPQGARVFLNGQFVGSTPLVLEDLPVGSRAVRIEAEGYQRWSASTQVVANQQTHVSATLGPAAR